MNCESSSVTIPSPKTPIVCVTVTIRPRSAACHGVPRWPTRYAVTIVFPCPGESACAAPQKSATPSEARITSSDRCERPTSCAKPPSATRSGASSAFPVESAGATSGPDAGASRPDAAVTSSGLWSMSFGYARSSWLRLGVVAPTSTSFQPMRSA